MLFVPNHGTRIVISPDSPIPDPTASMAAAAACGFDAQQVMLSTKAYTPFGYLFPDTPVPPHGPGTAASLDALAHAMVDQRPHDRDDADVPAITTFLGQFVAHDIAAETDAAPLGADAAPRDRAEIGREVVNLRTGALDLDSVYGGAAVQGPVADWLTPLLRDPEDPAKMRLGRDDPDLPPRPPLPTDPFGDLPRIGALLDTREISEAELRALDAPLRARFVTEDGAIRRHAALIGDARNDENLAVASVHLAYLRLHNAIVDRLREAGHFETPDRLFARAREQMRWMHQWLTVNAYLPSVCDPETVDAVLRDGAPLYGDFLAQAARRDPSHMPLPLEFGAAAFRFGQSSARPSYDWNLAFGTDGAILEEAGFGLLQEFSSAGGMDNGGVLPGNWVVDMTRFLNAGSDGPTGRRATKLIDTHVARPLAALRQARGSVDPTLRRMLTDLPRRTLRRSHRLAVPTAQACLDALARRGIVLPRLRPDQIDADLGEAAHAVAEATPLWFYVLREAEISAELDGATRPGGLRLGPLGSRIVAEVLAGLVIHGPDTYWTAKEGGRWHPRDGVQPLGEPIASHAAMMRAAGLLPPFAPGL